MGALAIVGAGISLYSGSKQKKESRKAGKRTEKLAGQNADLARTELDESLRVLAFEQERTRSTTRARAAASGVTLSGSISQYLARQQEEQTKAATFAEKAGESRISIIREGGQAAAKDIRARGDTAFIQGITQGVNTAVSWWK